MLMYSVQPGLGDVDIVVVDSIVDGGSTLGVAVASNVAVGKGGGTGWDGNARPGDTSDEVGSGASAMQPESSRLNSISQATRFLRVIIFIRQ
jgi:hypothetical protein